MGKYLGIDPGVRGAFVILSESGEFEEYRLIAKNSLDVLRTFVMSYDIEATVIEKSQAMGDFKGNRKQGISSMFNYGKGYGKLLALLELSDIPYKEVAPISWHSKMNIRAFGTDSKSAVKKMCEHFYPGHCFIPPRCRTIHDGLTDATVIAMYAMKYGRIDT